MATVIEQFKNIKRVSTPLVAFRTLDSNALQFELAQEYQDIPLTGWDGVNGLIGLNNTGKQAVKLALRSAGDVDESTTTSPVEALRICTNLPKETIVFAHNMQMFMEAQDQSAALIIQGLYNLRDLYKADRRTFVMLGPDFLLRPEINQHITVLDEPLPNDAQLEAIILDCHKAAGLQPPEKKVLIRAVDALRGLAAFPAEQVTAMSLTKAGLDMNGLWIRKIQMVEQTPGLSIWRGAESFDGVKGYDNCMNFMIKLADGKCPFRCVLFIDEVEKHLAGATGGDLSGVKQDMLGALLTWMQDRRVEGILFIGVPGSGKSAMAKAVGNYAKCLEISFDLAGVQESLVGKSGQNIRNALKVVDAISGGNCLVIATCNSIDALPPELRRRFSATFFFDVPGRYGKDAIWELYTKKPHPLATEPLSKKQTAKIPDDDLWTGAEIQKACQLAWKLDCSLLDAAAFVVPVAKSAPDQLQRLRSMANGTFLSASDGGIYVMPEEKTAKGPIKGRPISLN